MELFFFHQYEHLNNFINHNLVLNPSNQSPACTQTTEDLWCSGWMHWISDASFFDTLFLLVLSVVGVAKKIEWFGPSGDRIEPNRPDITVTLNDESSSVLTLYNAGNENEGTYKCVATNGDEQGESTIRVKIFRKRVFPFTPYPSHPLNVTHHIIDWCEHRREREKNVVYWTDSISLTAQGQHITLILFKWGWIFHQFNKWSEHH